MYEPTRQLVECYTELVRRVIMGGGVPLVGLQDKLRYPSGCTPRKSYVTWVDTLPGVLIPSQGGRRRRIFGFYSNKQTEKQTNKQVKTREFQPQLLHYFPKSDNKSNHHHWRVSCVVASKTKTGWIYKQNTGKKKRILSGVLLLSQGGRRSKDFWVFSQQTNKKPNK